MNDVVYSAMTEIMDVDVHRVIESTVNGAVRQAVTAPHRPIGYNIYLAISMVVPAVFVPKQAKQPTLTIRAELEKI